MKKAKHTEFVLVACNAYKHEIERVDSKECIKEKLKIDVDRILNLKDFVIEILGEEFVGIRKERLNERWVRVDFKFSKFTIITEYFYNAKSNLVEITTRFDCVESKPTHSNAKKEYHEKDCIKKYKKDLEIFLKFLISFYKIDKGVQLCK